MGLKGKLIGEVEVRSSGDLFHDLFATKLDELATISPSNVQGCTIHDGEFGEPGSTIMFHYTIKGKACVAKDVVESIDVEKKSITFNVVEGDLMEEYSSFKIHMDVTSEGGDLNLVKWVVEYEKLHEDIDHPILILDFLLNLSKHVEEHHLKDA